MKVEEDQRNDVKAEHFGQWNNIRKLLERRGPFSHKTFDPEKEDIFKNIRKKRKVLVIGNIFSQYRQLLNYD